MWHARLVQQLAHEVCGLACIAWRIDALDTQEALQQRQNLVAARIDGLEQLGLELGGVSGHRATGSLHGWIVDGATQPWRGRRMTLHGEI